MITKEKQETWGDYLKRSREAAGLTQRELARKSGVGYGSISQYETNFTGSGTSPIRPGEDVVEKLARALGVPLNEARKKAGYSPIETAQDEFEAFRSYLAELPSETREDALAIIKTLHARRKSALTQDLDGAPDFRVLPEAPDPTSN